MFPSFASSWKIEVSRLLLNSENAEGSGRQRHLFPVTAPTATEVTNESAADTGAHLQNEPIYIKETQQAAEKNVRADRH